MRFTGRVVDEGRLMRSVLGELLEAGVRVDVGIDEPSIARYAAINEFGSRDDRVPERSFLRSTLAENQGRYLRLMTDAATDVVNKHASPGEPCSVADIAYRFLRQHLTPSGELEQVMEAV